MPRVTFLRKESHQRYARDLLVLDFEEVLTSGEGGVAPFDPPALCPSGIGCAGLNLQASSGAPHLPSHGLKTQSVPSMKPEEKDKTDLPTNPKWQIGLFLCLKPFLGGAATPRSVVPLGG